MYCIQKCYVYFTFVPRIDRYDQTVTFKIECNDVYIYWPLRPMMPTAEFDTWRALGLLWLIASPSVFHYTYTRKQAPSIFCSNSVLIGYSRRIFSHLGHQTKSLATPSYPTDSESIPLWSVTELWNFPCFLQNYSYWRSPFWGMFRSLY
jgi:hypothetical protein